MHLTQREKDKLLIYLASQLAYASTLSVIGKKVVINQLNFVKNGVKLGFIIFY